MNFMRVEIRARLAGVKTAILAFSAAALVAAAAAQSEDWGDFDEEWANSPEYETSKALCRSLRTREPPPSDRPTPKQAAALRGCSSETLYYGIGRPPDPERARHCAFVEREENGEGMWPFAGRSMLMTIYANGVGARRDLEIAIHLACQMEAAPAESHGRVTHLAALREQGWTGTDFHFCDDVTSGLAAGYCADHGATIAGARREAELDRISGRFAPSQERAFAALRAAHAAYVDAHGEGEVDLAGTLRAAMQIGAQEALREELVETIRLLERGGEQPFGPGDFRRADAELNAAYRTALRADQGDHPGAVTAEGIRTAQRAWLRYRDAVLAFAALRHPGVPRDALAALLTVQRTRLLASEE
jgi:hypothetical protein